MSSSDSNLPFDEIVTDRSIDHAGLSCPENYKIRLPADRIYTATDFVNKKPFTPTQPEEKPDTSYTGEDYANKVPFPKE